MLFTLEKRGPDQKGSYFNDNIALGHQRLSVIDLSEAGNQPMLNEDETVAVVHNGEIYNYKELRSQLSKEHLWKSQTDTETIVHGYEEWRDRLFDKIEGMFAFAVYDKKKSEIILARDHFGKKPLYYYLDEEIFCFASEPKAIVKNPQIKNKLKIDQLSLAKYLFYGYIPSPNSIFDGIKKLEPATFLKFDIKEWKIKDKQRYWKPEKIEVNNNLSEKEILEKTEDLIKNSIRKRLMSDVPLGIFLSGGIDSSLMSAYFSEVSKDLNAFTVGYQKYKELDETNYAEIVSSKFNIKHHVCYSDDENVKENFLEIMDYLDEPLADAALIPLYFVSKFAKEKITVALGGDGGDELFGGYPKYKAQYFIEKFRYLKFLSKIGKNFISKNSPYYKLLTGFDLKFHQRQFIFGSGGFLAEETASLLKEKRVNPDDIFKEAENCLNLFRSNDDVNKSLFLDCLIQLPDWYMAKVDRATMANSLEMRSPLLDKKLAEFAFSLEGKWKIKNGKQKYILKKLAGKYFEEDFINRKKSGFVVPLNQWIKNELKDIFEEYLFAENDYFNSDYIKKIYNLHESGKADCSFGLLRIFVFNYWLKKDYDK